MIIHIFVEYHTCRENTFRCDTGQCIDYAKRCDNKDDCLDRSDEFHCGD